jgi:hypothetical protein
MTLFTFRQSRWTHYHRLHSRKLRSVYYHINELKKVPSHVVEGQDSMRNEDERSYVGLEIIGRTLGAPTPDLG